MALMSLRIQLLNLVSKPRQWSLVRNASKKTTFSPLLEHELEEHHVKGSGPGGQSVNKTNNCVVLKHIPTGIAVKSHESRSLVTNRNTARKKLQERLDVHFHGDESVLMQEKKEKTYQKRTKRNKTNEKLEKLKAFKEREGMT